MGKSVAPGTGSGISIAALLLEAVDCGGEGAMPARFCGGGGGPVTPCARSGTFSPKSGSCGVVVDGVVDLQPIARSRPSMEHSISARTGTGPPVIPHLLALAILTRFPSRLQ